jgi:predicted deacylase
LTIQDDAAGTVKLHVGIVNGAGEGPVFCVTGGMFGTQYGGIDAIIRIFNEIDPKKLKGTLITVPVIDMPSFQKGVDRSPIDNLALNSIFPGDPNGTVSRRIAHVVLNEIIKKSQYHLDIRGGDLSELLIDFMIGYTTGKEEFDSENIALAKVLRVKYYTMTSESRGMLVAEACKMGVNSVVLLAYKGVGTYEEKDIEKCRLAISNMMMHLKMLEGEPDIPYQPKELEFYMNRVDAKQGGLLYLDVEYGDLVTKGQKLGEIINLKGETLETLTAPDDGIVHAVFPKHIKQPGELILTVRRFI